MDLKRALSVTLQLALAAVVIALVVGQFLGQPILLSFVETGSMEPTLDPGDGFVAVPAELSGEIQQGDVIVFHAEEIQGGGLTTHRVVEVTEQGYITRGDANPFTDQDGDEPVVRDAQVVATALQVGGSVVAIPHLGTAVMGLQAGLETIQRQLAAALGTRALLGPQGIAYVLFALSVLAYAADYLLFGSAGKQRLRERTRNTGTSARTLLLVLALVLVITATAAMVVPAGTEQFTVVSAEFESDNPTVIERGTAEELPYLVPNAGLVPVHVYLEPASEGVAVEPEHTYVGSRSETTATLTLSAPDETGAYRRFVTERRYLAVLPAPVIDELYRIHPWLPIVAINTVLAGGIYGLGRFLLGTGRIRDRNRTHRGRRLRRLIRSLYE
ncbi:Signal peptidase I [Halalkaliarchaeum sp. AArc-CO]|uniref:signal peptidase I n=1 Tax=unclassified Halalkaliarchaeum TaxID=2678344 RepID=UPI00217DFBBC|nr:MULTISPECIES: signal peptidase I [unclassified Halalkaliarchaeum]MDR5671931.1 signal peptidase I [Halalkaliarchaeum sp. AArc-GB]UWG51435.1 Signal peptidase I [Halalkaliarchaeum sp. AArc-CO]